jgi:hypothetical protein
MKRKVEFENNQKEEKETEANEGDTSNEEISFEEGEVQVKISTILARNGASPKLIEYMEKLALAIEDDPPVVMDWMIEKLLFVLNNPIVQAGAPIPSPILLPIPPITEATLKTAILNSIRGPVPMPAFIPGNTFGFEATQAQVGHICATATAQSYNAWWAYQDAQSITLGNGSICPIAHIYIPLPRSNTMVRTGKSAIRPPTPLFD